jgi:hypothetical protein
VPPNCDDGNVCTTDGCNPASGCTHVNNTDPCNDGNACTTNDTCSGGACVGGAPPNCDDGNVCTTDGCNTQTGCVHTNNTNPCDDQDSCTVNDTCSGGVCTGTPTAVKYTGGGQFIAMNGDKWSFGFNFRGTTTGPTNGEFNGVDHTSGLHINGPVFGIVSPCGNTGDCPNSPNNSVTFQVRDKKTGCIYRVTVEDNGESGAGRDMIQIVSDPFGSCSFAGTGCNLLSAGNIQKHPPN